MPLPSWPSVLLSLSISIHSHHTWFFRLGLLLAWLAHQSSCHQSERRLGQESRWTRQLCNHCHYQMRHDFLRWRQSVSPRTVMTSMGLSWNGRARGKLPQIEVLAAPVRSAANAEQVASSQWILDGEKVKPAKGCEAHSSSGLIFQRSAQGRRSLEGWGCIRRAFHGC